MTSLAATYAEARERFLEAADRAGGRSAASLHPLAGREGEELAIDVTVVGPTDSEAALVIVSGTHGVEGYTGSALQTHWLNDHVDLRPQNVSVVLVHGLTRTGSHGCGGSTRTTSTSTGTSSTGTNRHR